MSYVCNPMNNETPRLSLCCAAAQVDSCGLSNGHRARHSPPLQLLCYSEAGKYDINLK